MVHVLKDYVEVVEVVEKTVHAEDVLMVEATLKADLEAELIDHKMRLYHSLRDLFDSQITSTLLMSACHHHPKLPFS